MVKWFLVHGSEILEFETSTDCFLYMAENVDKFEFADFSIIAGEKIEYKNGKPIK